MRKTHVYGFITKKGIEIRILMQDPRGLRCSKSNHPVSNSEAEYEAMAGHMSIVQKVGTKCVMIHSDAQSVAHQMPMACEKRKEQMIKYADKVKVSRSTFSGLGVIQIPQKG